MTNKNKPLLTLTEAAANRVKTLMKDTESDVIGLRIGIKTAGCSGMKYNVEYAKDIKPFEEKIISDPLKMKKNLIFLLQPNGKLPSVQYVICGLFENLCDIQISHNVCAPLGNPTAYSVPRQEQMNLHLYRHSNRTIVLRTNREWSFDLKNLVK